MILKVTQLPDLNAPVGVWRGEEDEARVQFTVRRKGTSFSVEAEDWVDGERLTVSDIQWDGKSLRFVTLTPSTGRACRNTMIVVEPSVVEISYEIQDRYVAKRFAP